MEFTHTHTLKHTMYESILSSVRIVFAESCLLCADYDYYMTIMRLSFVSHNLSQFADEALHSN